VIEMKQGRRKKVERSTSGREREKKEKESVTIKNMFGGNF
jgi:hypothetical protein